MAARSESKGGVWTKLARFFFEKEKGEEKRGGKRGGGNRAPFTIWLVLALKPVFLA